MTHTGRTLIDSRTSPSWRQRISGRAFGTALQRALIYGVLILAGIAFLFPLAWMLSTSLKEKGQVMAIPPVLIPDPIRWANYPDALCTKFPLPFLL